MLAEANVDFGLAASRHAMKKRAVEPTRVRQLSQSVENELLIGREHNCPGSLGTLSTLSTSSTPIDLPSRDRDEPAVGQALQRHWIDPARGQDRNVDALRRTGQHGQRLALSRAEPQVGGVEARGRGRRDADGLGGIRASPQGLADLDEPLPRQRIHKGVEPLRAAPQRRNERTDRHRTAVPERGEHPRPLASPGPWGRVRPPP